MMDNLKTLGNLLYDSRCIRGLSLREVEEVTGISNSYLSQIENDKIKKPSVHILHKLAKLYEISFDKLLEASGVLLNLEKMGSPSTLVGSVFQSKGITQEEENLLSDYLAFLRFRNKNKGKF